ncbi:MAG: serine/threonine-protein phosphatase [Phycisphaerae bacterium]|nr:serine/threonine-protein phosphatase [Phycisphaerae bacterium]
MEVFGGNRAVDTKLRVQGLEAWIHARPHQGDDGGGDIHYLSSCASGRIARVLLADISGHGAAVDELAGKLRALMRRYVNYLNQSSFVEKLNREFMRLTDCGIFATGLVATFWAPTSFLRLSNAGHPKAMHRSASSGRWVLLAPPPTTDEGLANVPLGIAPDTRYDQMGIKLNAGDLLIFYTDSLVEAFDANRRLLGEAGLLDLVQSLPTEDPEALMKGLVDGVSSFAGQRPFDDDVTIMVLRATGAPYEAPSTSENLTALARFGRMAIDRLRGRLDALPWPEINLANLLGPLIPALNRRVGGESDDSVGAGGGGASGPRTGGGGGAGTGT